MSNKAWASLGCIGFLVAAPLFGAMVFLAVGCAGTAWHWMLTALR